MNFGLSDEQELLQETVRGFVANECPLPKLREIFESQDGYDATLWDGMVEMGLGGLVVPESYGGAGLELLDLALVEEVLGEGAVPGPFFGHSLATLALTLGGSPEQKERWLPQLASGEALGTVALGEDDEAWDPAVWTAKVSEGQVTGEKAYVPYGERADLIIVGVGGGGLVAVTRESSGLKVEPVNGVDRTRRLARVTLQSAPCESLPEAAADRVRDAGLVLLAADAFGGASKLISMAVEYARTREQFGQPIAQFQAVKHRLADMVTEIEPARGLYWYAAHAFDRIPDQAERAAALAKAHLSDRFMQIARDTVEVHGGIGFTWESDVQIWFKRAMFDRTFLGAPAHHRERAAQLADW